MAKRKSLGINFECRCCDYKKFYPNEVVDDCPRSCPKCGSGTYRLRFCYEKPREEPLINIDATMQPRERWSDAMGVHPNQIPEAIKRYPGSVYDKEGRLLIRNRAHKKFEMKRRGYIEYD